MKGPFFALLVCASLATSAQPLVIAHRGASAYKPENSISAFEEAIHMKADYIETDVHQTKDGVVVIMHDFSVNRTCTNGNKCSEVKDLTYSEFCTLKIKDGNEQPPSLDSAIRFINGRCKLLIEIKKGGDFYPGIENKILDIIKNNHAEAWVDIIHSFDKQALLKLQEQKTGARLQKLIVFKFPLASFTFSRKTEKDDLSAWQGVNVNGKFASRRIIRKLHRQNKTVFVWTVDSKRQMRKLIRRGADGIITNRPDIARELIENKKPRSI
jgi:glycerophosphoryl diester phosphodiesterase